MVRSAAQFLKKCKKLFFQICKKFFFFSKLRFGLSSTMVYKSLTTLILQAKTSYFFLVFYFILRARAQNLRGVPDAYPVYFLGRLGGVSDPPQIFSGNLGRWGGSVFSAGFEVFPRRGVKSYTFTPYPKKFSPAAPFFLFLFCSAKKKIYSSLCSLVVLKKNFGQKKQTDPPQT